MIAHERHRRGARVSFGGCDVGVVDGGVVVGGLRRALVGDEPLALSCGPLALRVTQTRAGAAVKDDDIDVAWWKSLAMSLVLVLGAVAGLRLTPKHGSLDDDDLFRGRTIVTRVALPPKPVTPQQPTRATRPRPQTQPATTTAKARAPQTMKQKRIDDHAQALAALKAMGIGEGGAVSNVFGEGGGSGVNVALGRLRGAGALAGTGLATRDTGSGSGGVGVDIGRLGSGTALGSGGNGDIDLLGRGPSRTQVVPGKLILEGALDRAEIQRVLSRVMSRIKYCYERELNAHPDLEGKLTAQFTIGGSGDVTSASALQSTLAGGVVDACVLRILRQLKFPQPRGGGVVSVTYPFVFATSGD